MRVIFTFVPPLARREAQRGRLVRPVLTFEGKAKKVQLAMNALKIQTKLPNVPAYPIYKLANSGSAAERL